MGNKLKDYTYKNIRIGENLISKDVFVTQEMIDGYAVASLDYNPVHTDLDWVKKTQVFGQPSTVAHGMMTLSFMVSVATDWCSKKGYSISEMEAKFTRPVWPGQSYIVEGYVKEIHPSLSFVILALRMKDKSGDEVVGVCNIRVNI